MVLRQCASNGRRLLRIHRRYSERESRRTHGAVVDARRARLRCRGYSCDPAQDIAISSEVLFASACHSASSALAGEGGAAMPCGSLRDSPSLAEERHDQTALGLQRYRCEATQSLHIRRTRSPEAAIVSAAATTAAKLATKLQGADPLAALARLKFAQAGCDPLDLNRSLNFVEQLNQSFTSLASLEATRWLFERHPDRGPFHLNLGTAPGADIASADGAVAAEVFAATHPDSNDKLRKDVKRFEICRRPTNTSSISVQLRPSSEPRTWRLFGLITCAYAIISTRRPNVSLHLTERPASGCAPATSEYRQHRRARLSGLRS